MELKTYGIVNQHPSILLEVFEADCGRAVLGANFQELSGQRWPQKHPQSQPSAASCSAALDAIEGPAGRRTGLCATSVIPLMQRCIMGNRCLATVPGILSGCVTGSVRLSYTAGTYLDYSRCPRCHTAWCHSHLERAGCSDMLSPETMSASHLSTVHLALPEHIWGRYESCFNAECFTVYHAGHS